MWLQKTQLRYQKKWEKKIEVLNPIWGVIK